MRLSFMIRSFTALLLFLLPALARAQASREFGTVTVTARPANADVFVDGERWMSPETTGPLVVQLSPGRHTIEVRAAGYRPFRTVIDVRAGETTPVNVMLPSGAPEREPAGPPSGPRRGPVRQVSQTTSDDGFVFAPDFRITELNHRTTGFAGFYGGYVFARRIMVGGGAYFQLEDRHSEQMSYGGAVAEWRLFDDSPVGLTLHGLAGYGQAAADVSYAFNGRNHMDRFDGRDGFRDRFTREFWVGEPEAQVVAHFGGHIRLVGGLGYRFTSADSADLNGVSGSVSLQIGK